MSKPLGQVVDRIALLGHTLAHCEREFEYLSAFNDFDPAQFRFDELKEALATIDVNAISADYGMGEDFGKFFRRQLFDRLRLASIAADPSYAQHPEPLSGRFAESERFLRSLAGNWSSLAMLSFAPVTGAPRIKYGNALLVDLANRWRNCRNVHIRTNAP
jgi:hypothetical protein